jgi:glycosyltransferase involved in cell wall biosynthesis
LTVAGDVWFYQRETDRSDSYRTAILNGLSELRESRFLGHVDHGVMSEIYRQHHIAFVLSRSKEPFGLVALEAMASGCAVIASNRGGLPEAVGDAAVLLDPEDVPGVTAALMRFCQDRNELTKFRERALSHAAKSDWGRAAAFVVNG